MHPDGYLLKKQYAINGDSTTLLPGLGKAIGSAENQLKIDWIYFFIRGFER